MGLGRAALKLGATALYAIEFACAAVILGIYSYFLAVQADRNAPIDTWEKAVTGLSGAVVLYCIFAVLLTCFLGGKTIFALLAVLFNVLCCGAMIAIAVMTRDGAGSCSGYVETPLGNGDSSSKEGFGSDGQGNQITYAASLGTTCRLNTACFAVSIIGAFFFLISALLQFALRRDHKKEKAFGPSPTNGYTQGSGTKFWQRKKRAPMATDPEVGTVPVGAGGLAPPVAGHNYRASHDTAYTGSTVGAPGATYEHNKPVTGGYHTAPAGTYQSPATNY
ncbi:hypothetical protein NX059_008682 [Plenodomus lindquistii]|nr:hypothetical protein NX059_008682 [Plenodomus lindquistii]